MKHVTRGWRGTLVGAALVSAVCLTMTASVSAAAPTKHAGSVPCPPYSSVKSILNPRPLPADLDPTTAMPPVTTMPSTSAALGTKQALKPTWYTQLTVTPAQQKAICAKHLTAVYIDWDSVPFNQAIRW